MYKYTFSNGDVVTSKLTKDVLIQRMRRLDTLRVMTEQLEDGTYQSICRKALAAYNKTNDFTGIIRLTRYEKEMLLYLLEDGMLTDDEKEAIKFYTRQ